MNPEPVNINMLGLPESPPEHPGERLLARWGACVTHPIAKPDWWLREEFSNEVVRSLPTKELVKPRGRNPYIHTVYRSPRWHALDICQNECPVRSLCQQVGDHIEDHETDPAKCGGVRGGETAAERARRRKAALREEAA